MRSLVDEKVAREGLLGVAIVGGVAVVAGLLGSVVWRGLGRKR